MPSATAEERVNRPIDISIWPPISIYNSEKTDIIGLSLNLPAGVSHWVYGLQIGIGFNKAWKVRGIQVSGVANVVQQGGIRGLQFAGLINNVWGDCWGICISGMFNHHEWLHGIQIAGLANFTSWGGMHGWGATYGVQIAGFYTGARRFYGLTATIGFNAAESANGVQLAGLFNKAGSLHGLQIGAINVAGTVRGVQLGLVNYARELKGLQIGAVNIATRNTLPVTVVLNAGW